ncbi:MAG: cytochrome oxidase putative small subunit CydP [Azonexus sp.]
MKPQKQRLRQEIILLIVLKLVAIIALWWYFVRDVRVTVDPDIAAEHIGSPQKEAYLARRNP